MEKLAECVRKHAITDMYKLAKMDDYKETPKWKIAEYAAAVIENGCLFMSLDYSLRKMLHGGGKVATTDRGVDVVEEDCTLSQVKWYKDDAVIGNDPFARLISISVASTRMGFQPRLKMIIGANNRIAEGIPNVDMVETIKYTDQQLEDAIKVAKEKLALIDDDNYEKISPDVYENLHNDVVSKLTTLIENGRGIVSAELPPGSGKSYIIGKLVRYHATKNPGKPVIIIVPRVEIARQLSKLYGDMLGLDLVATIADGSNWPDNTNGLQAIVLSGQSAHKIPQPFEASAVMYDESHVEYGRTCIEEHVQRTSTYMLSATMRGKVDYRLSYMEAVKMGLICDARFVFAVFERKPALCDYVEHIINHPEHMAILACFQHRDKAKKFVALCNEKHEGMARSFVTGDDNAALEQFRSGKIRVLCIVSRAEMGVNIHICDTILLVDLWYSIPRLRQLCGRATRLHPLKAGIYSVLIGVGPDQTEEHNLVSRMVDALHNEISDRCPENIDELMDKIEIIHGGGGNRGAYAEEEIDAVTAMYINVYTSFGRHIKDDVVKDNTLKVRYATIKMQNQLLKLTSQEEYKQSEKTHTQWIDDPKSYFSKRWISWYDFLGVDTSAYPQTKEEWRTICIDRDLNEQNYFEKKYDDLPTNPSEMYDNFTRFSEELAINEEHVW